MKNALTRRTYLALAGGAAAATLIPTAAFADSTLAAIKQRGMLKMGVKYDNPGFGYLKPGESEPTGFEIDLAHEITKRILGDPKKVQFTQVITSNRIPMVQNGDIDMFIATATITPPRLKQIAFSNVYYSAGQSLLVKSSSPIKSYKDLDGKSVCTAKGSTPEQTIQKLVPSVHVQTFDGYTPCYQALLDGRTDAITTDNTILIGFQDQNPKELKMVGGLFTFEPYGIGIALGNDTLLKAVNDALVSIGNDGTFAKIHQKWLHEPLPSNWKTWYCMPAEKAAEEFANQPARK
ncbi:MAG: glutamate ABC transporter substrate-binding protein [Vulcanimicrobiaceae bacterium]